MSLLFAAMLISVQAAANPPSGAPTETAAPAPAPIKEKKICKTEEPMSGSHMSKRVCLTEQGWAQRDAGMNNSAHSGHSASLEDH